MIRKSMEHLHDHRHADGVVVMRTIIDHDDHDHDHDHDEESPADGAAATETRETDQVRTLRICGDAKS